MKLKSRSVKFPRVNLLIYFFLNVVPMVEGHSDPWGDTHPNVTVVDGRFSIVFSSSQPEENPDFADAKPMFRTIYTAEGKLFAPRHALVVERSRREVGPVGLYGREFPLDESTVIIQPNRSGYLLKSPEGKLTRVRLPWPKNAEPDSLEEVLVTPEGIAMTGKDGNPSRLDPEGGPLKFYWFAHDSTEAPTVLTIGSTACIYHFPVASNVVFAGGKFWVAYMRPTENEELKLSLWSWKPGDKKGKAEDLDSPAHWNSHLSMAAIGDQLCLAYHCVTDRRYPGNSRIMTVFKKAK